MLTGMATRILIAACCVLWSLCVGTAWAGAPDIIQIEQAEVVISDALTAPPDDAGWQFVALPHRSSKPTAHDLVSYWYRLHFRAADTRQQWLFFPKLRSGGTIFVNGRQVGQIRGADEMVQIRWFRPYLFYLPPSIVQAGDNVITVHLTIREPLTSFGTVSLGPEQPLRDSYDLFFFWENTSTHIASVICLLTGSAMLVLWWRRRQEILYAVFGLCVLMWGLRTPILLMPEVPMAYWVLWRFLYYLTTCGFITCITIFLLRFSALRMHLLERFLILNWLLGSVVFLLLGSPARPFMDTYWVGSFLPFVLYALLQLVIFVTRRRTPSGVAMLLAILFSLGLAIHDFAVQHGMFHLQEVYLLHLGIPAFLLVMGSMLLNRFIDSLVQVESVNEQLSLRIARREQELASNNEKLRRFEREHAATDERQRIMQDMHDGVGSQLLTTLVMVQEGYVAQKDMADLLQACLDDMRLVIDAMSPDEPDMLPALGNFRYRMESRFKRIGLTLQWHNHSMPDALEIVPHAGLQILRILQEALSNVLKHAQAKVVTVDVVFGSEFLRIQVKDDGIGFAGEVKPFGRGMVNMRSRARKIGGTLRIELAGPGASVQLDIPLSAICAAPSSVPSEAEISPG